MFDFYVPLRGFEESETDNSIFVDLNKKMKGPDHKASVDPMELKQLVDNIRKTEIILGSQNKDIQPEERNMLKISKKGLYFSRKLDQFSKITRKDLLNISKVL